MGMTGKERAAGTTWTDPDDAPELTDAWFAKAELYQGERRVRRGGGPKRPRRSRRSIFVSIPTCWCAFARMVRAGSRGSMPRCGRLPDWVDRHDARLGLVGCTDRTARRGLRSGRRRSATLRDGIWRDTTRGAQVASVTSGGERQLMSVLDRFRLDGKRLFITGGSRGLGREMALAIAEAGADVVLVGRDADSLTRTAADIRAIGRNAWPLQADAGTPEGCERACRDALALGPIDILINNIGGRRVNVPIEDEPLEVWQQMLDLNLTSTFLCTKLIGGAMLARGPDRPWGG